MNRAAGFTKTGYREKEPDIQVFLPALSVGLASLPSE